MSKEVVAKHTEVNDSFWPIFKHSIVAGIGWAFGVTVGFVLISTIVIFGLRQLGGLPLVGNWIADVVEATQSQLYSRTPIFRDFNSQNP